MGARAGVRRPRWHRPNAPRARRLAQGRAVRDRNRPAARAHARGPKEGRLRLLRATRVQLEPIFLLYDGPAPVERPEREPDLEVEGARLWRIDDPLVVRTFDDKQLLIADGHHRYETAVAFHEEEGTPASAQMLVVLVSTDDPGLEIFPTHRLFASPSTSKARTAAPG